MTILLISSSRGRLGRVPTLMAAALVFAPVAMAQSPAREAIERGHQQFKQSCGFCHGEEATGARGPDLVRSTLVAHDVNGNLIGEVIRSGRPDKGMPALPLTSAQIADITAVGRQRGDVSQRKRMSIRRQMAIERRVTDICRFVCAQTS